MRETKSQNAYETLRKEILNGRYSSIDPFPSVVGACRRFDLSRLTVVKVFDKLKSDGLISARSGAGTFVTRLGRSRKIGLIIPGICYSDVFPPICNEISRQAQKAGYFLLFGNLTASDPAERARKAKDLAKQYVDEGVSGVIVQPIEFLEDADAVNKSILSVFDSAKVPVVLLDCDIVASPGRSEYDIVGVNNAEAGRRLATHLVESGSRRVVFLAEPHSDYSIQDRIRGVREVLSKTGAFAELSVNVGEADAVKKLLARRPRPDAVICRNDHQAAHLMATLREIGKCVPKDLQVAGFNDVDYAALLEPGLTTIRLPSEEIGRQAFSLLLERIANPALLARECYLPAPLVVRGSTSGKNKHKQGEQ